jgi:hypothetical protein
MDYNNILSQGRMRHADLIAEAQREALYAATGTKQPSLLTRLANLFAMRKPAQRVAPRTATAK